MIPLPSEGELVLRLVLAAVLGAAVGFERELFDHPAGLRTHLTVALGSALFAIVSAYGFESFGDLSRDESSYQVDVTRVASNIVTGVGFLGGGAILKHGVSVRGLTTAASLWVTAAIGLAVGLGTYLVAVVAAVVMLVVLLGLRGPVRYIERRWARQHQFLVVRLVNASAVGDLLAFLRDVPGLSIRSVDVVRDGARAEVQVELRGRPGMDLDATTSALGQRDDVVSVQSY